MRAQCEIFGGLVCWDSADFRSIYRSEIRGDWQENQEGQEIVKR